MTGNAIDKIRGRAAAVLKRAPSTKQTDSTRLQGRNIEQLAAEADLTIVKQIELHGVTGSVPGARTDIDELIALKRNGLSFDLLVVGDTSRFSRAGQVHGMKLIHDLLSRRHRRLLQP
ncbi:MAG: recombinase family protein [Phycisphaerae bacterium]